MSSVSFEEHQVIQALFTLINVVKYFSGETSRGFEILNNTRAWINAVALIISSLPVSKSYQIWLSGQAYIISVISDQAYASVASKTLHIH